MAQETATTNPMTAVQVSNISPNATEKTVADFFSFCGKISKLFLSKEEGKDTSTAVVEFETESAAKTALLLTNALIVDKPIVVTPFGAPIPESTSETPETPDSPVSPKNLVSDDKINHRDFGGVPDHERTKTSVVASMIAAGYVLASDALQKAKHYDEEHNITLNLKVGMEQMKVKAHEFDKTYGISEKAETVKKQASEKVKKINEDYKISEKANAAATSVKENPTVKGGLDKLNQGWNSVSTTVTGYYNDYRAEVDKAIDEKKKQKLTLEGGNVKEVEIQSQEPEGGDASTESPVVTPQEEASGQ